MDSTAPHAEVPRIDALDADLVDAAGRPYFLWDVDMTLDAFRQGLHDVDPAVRAYLVAKLLRQARPEHVGRFVTDDDVRAVWPWALRHLGRVRAEWERRLGIGGASPAA